MMGYTHYWRRQPTLDPVAFSAWVTDVQCVFEHLPERTSSAGGYYRDEPLLICGRNGTGQPEFTASLVCFNGNAPELDHESFFLEQEYHPEKWEYLEEGRYFAFCKTARKPYDLLVTASLIRLAYHFPSILIDSDGEANDWQEALQLCQDIFGEAILPFEKEGEER